MTPVISPPQGTGAVTSTSIADGTIVNADVAADAAIAYSKLNLSGWPGTVGGPAKIVRKTADETVNNSNTLQDDDHLLLAIGASDVWWIEAVLFAQGASVNADWLFGWTGPSGATATWGPSALNTTVNGGLIGTNAAGTPAAGLRQISDSVALGGRGSTIAVLLAGKFLGGGTAGNITLQWAQNTQTSEDSSILTHSFLRATRLA